MERWAAIEGHPGYEVSTAGRVRNAQTGKDLAQQAANIDYRSVSISAGGKKHKYYVHRLVAQAWAPNHDGKPFVNHINGKRDDNRAENLEWVTMAENNNKKLAPGQEGWCRAVVQLSLDGAVIGAWKSARHADEALRIARTSITKCCRGQRASAGGYKWKYGTEHENDVQDEHWVPVTGFGVIVEASSLGRVRTRNGTVTSGAKGTMYLRTAGHNIHRVIATAFCQKEEGKDIVNHINGVKTDNRCDNLEWVTRRDNTLHAASIGCLPCRPVVRTYPDGTLETYPSMAEAQRETGIGATQIWQVCNGVGVSAGGSSWAYAEPEYDLSDVYGQGDDQEKIHAIADDDPIWAELGLDTDKVV